MSGIGVRFLSSSLNRELINTKKNMSQLITLLIKIVYLIGSLVGILQRETH